MAKTTALSETGAISPASVAAALMLESRMLIPIAAAKQDQSAFVLVVVGQGVVEHAHTALAKKRF